MILGYVEFFFIFCYTVTAGVTLVASILQVLRTKKTTWAEDNVKTLSLFGGWCGAITLVIHLLTTFLVEGNARTFISWLGIKLSTTQSFLLVPFCAFGMGALFIWGCHVFCLRVFRVGKTN